MEFTQDLVRELLDYDPGTGHFMWRERDKKWFRTERDCKAWNTRFAGTRAGSVTGNVRGYKWRQIGLFGRPYYEHRLAWLYMTGEVPPEVLDHINRDATDNRWANLRKTSTAANSHNLSISSRNTSGITGVSWQARRNKWMAYGKLSDRMKNLGLFAEVDEAAMEAMEFRAEHGFTPTHGIDFDHCRRMRHPLPSDTRAQCHDR